MIVFLAAALIAYACFAGGAPLAGLAVVTGYCAWYRYSIGRRPYRPCWWCRGSGWRSGIDPGNDSEYKRTPIGRCWVCHGRKSQVRWGVRVLTPSVYRDIRAGKRGRNY